MSMAWSADSQTLAVGTTAGSIRLWDVGKRLPGKLLRFD
jgi:WD40 repeat protein